MVQKYVLVTVLLSAPLIATIIGCLFQQHYNNSNLWFRAFVGNVVRPNMLKRSLRPQLTHDMLCSGSTPLPPHITGMLSACLFLKTNKTIDAKFKQKYLDSFFKIIDYFPRKFPMWQMRIYLSPNLLALKPRLELCGVNVCVVNHNACDDVGAIWRYFSICDPNVTVPIKFFDIDDFHGLTTGTPNNGEWQETFGKWHTLPHKKFFYRPGGIWNTLALPPIWGCRWGCRPGAIPNMLQIYETCRRLPKNRWNFYGLDEHVARHYVYPLMTYQNTLYCQTNDEHIYIYIGSVVYLTLLIYLVRRESK